MANNNNHFNGDSVRKKWPVGMKVYFKPKRWAGGKELIGIIEDHIYVNVLIITSNETRWWVSTQRCRPHIQKQLSLFENEQDTGANITED